MKKQPSKSIKKERDLEKRQLGLNQILKPVLYLVISIIFEIASFLILGFNKANGGTQILPTYLFFDVGLWLIVISLMLCSPKNWLSNIFFYVSIFIKTALLIINIVLRGDFGYLFTLDMSSLIFEAFESIDMEFINVPLILICVFATALVVALPLIFDKLLKNHKITIKKISRPIFCLLCFFITFTLGIGSYSISIATIKQSSSDIEITSDQYLFDNMHIKDTAYRKFGTAGFYLKNIYNLAFSRFELNKAEKEAIIKTFNEAAVSVNTEAKLHGDNLIVIMLESYEWFAIDPYNTPNLWALKTGTNNGTSIPDKASIYSNYVSNNKTNVSEDVCLLGYMPNINTINLKGSKSYSAKYSLPNLFNNLGYTTSFFHNWKGNFYERETVNKNIGFQNIYTIEDFENQNKSTRFNYWNLDTDFAKQFINQIAPTDKKFMSYYTTITTHGSYEVKNDRLEAYYQKYDTTLEVYKDWLQTNGYVYPENKKDQAILKQYKSAAMDTDTMIGVLFDHLTTTGLIDNTTVVIYSDHNAFYHDLSCKIKGTNVGDYKDIKTYTVPLMIYSKKLTTVSSKGFCSVYDLYPTISNAFGLGYNKICAQGVDMLSAKEKNPIYVSYLTGYYNGYCYSKDMNHIIKYEGAPDSEVNDLKFAACEFYKKQKTLETIYNTRLTY